MSKATALSIVSHDFSDPCTWYQGATRKTGVSAASVSGLVYTLSDQDIIDLTHGRVTQEHLITGHDFVVYDGGSPISDYTVDYETGVVTLGSSPSGAVTFDYSHANRTKAGSLWSYEPADGSNYTVRESEVNFTVDLVITNDMISTVQFNHPSLGWVDVDSETNVYKSIKDIINVSRGGVASGTSMQAGVDVLTQAVIERKFEYDPEIQLNYGDDLRIAFYMKDGQPLTAEFATITLYTRKVEL